LARAVISPRSAACASGRSRLVVAASAAMGWMGVAPACGAASCSPSTGVSSAILPSGGAADGSLAEVLERSFGVRSFVERSFVERPFVVLTRPATELPTKPADPIRAAALPSEAGGSCTPVEGLTLGSIAAFTGVETSIPDESAELSDTEVARAVGAAMGAMLGGSGCGDCSVPDCWCRSVRRVSCCELSRLERLAPGEEGMAQLLPLRTLAKASAGAATVEGRAAIRGVVVDAELVGDVAGRFTPEKNASRVPSLQSVRMTPRCENP